MILKEDWKSVPTSMELDDLEDKLQSAFPEIRTKKDRKSGIRQPFGKCAGRVAF